MIAAHFHANLTALAAGGSERPDAVLFTSQGAVLVIGDDSSVAGAVNTLAAHLPTSVCAPGMDGSGLARQVTALNGRVCALHGHFGAFRAEMAGESGPVDIGAASPNRDGVFDMVLDLGRRPLISAPVPPIGYFAPGQSAAALTAAMASMRALVGRFTKPRYFTYEPGICAHSASGVPGCTRCLNVCSAQAIVSTGAQIRVDPHMCQGCATCALACPSGALSFNAPSAAQLRQQLRSALQAAPASVLLVHSTALAATVQAAIGARAAKPLIVDPLPAFGEELWFEAFALGARALVLLDDEQLLPLSRVLVESRIAQARTVLQSLGIAPGRLGFMPATQLPQWLDALAGQAPAHKPVDGAPGVTHAATRDTRSKRAALLDAIATLAEGRNTATVVNLPADANFGGVSVDRELCTLCYACTNLCPTGALRADTDGLPRLRFVEDACIQCGMCERACPEKAVSLHPRFIPVSSHRLEASLLQQDELFPCTDCGTPFISRRLLESSLKRMKDHPVLEQGGRERLMTCPACRQSAMLQV